MSPIDNWYYQWSAFSKDGDYLEYDLMLFKEWIYPFTLEGFSGKTVLDCGCGRGQHLKLILPYIRSGTGVDLNTSEVAKKYISDNKLQFISGDIAAMPSDDKYDVVYSIGVLHHTDSPEASFQNIKKCVKSGGRLIIWVYSHEGNFLNRTLLEPFNRHIGSRINRNFLLLASILVTALLCLPIYTLYLLPLKFLPFFEYFSNFRRLSFKRNVMNVFDKLNAPQTRFIKRETVEKWFDPAEFTDVHISMWKGVSWRASGMRK